MHESYAVYHRARSRRRYSLPTRLVSAALVLTSLFLFTQPYVSLQAQPVPVPALGSTPTYGSGDLDPYFNYAESSRSQADWEYIVEQGKYVLAATWETSIDAEIEGYVNAVAQSDHFNTVAEYREYLRGELLLQKQSQFAAWESAANLEIDQQRVAFLSELAEEKERAAAEESDDSVSAGRAEAAQEESTTEDIERDYQEWERDFQKNFADGLYQFQTALAKLQAQYDTANGALAEKEAEFLATQARIDAYEETVRQGISTATAFMQNYLNTSGVFYDWNCDSENNCSIDYGSPTAAASTMQTLIDDLNDGLANDQPLSVLANTMYTALDAQRTFAQTEYNNWLAQSTGTNTWSIGLNYASLMGTLPVNPYSYQDTLNYMEDPANTYISPGFSYVSQMEAHTNAAIAAIKAQPHVAAILAHRSGNSTAVMSYADAYQAALGNPQHDIVSVQFAELYNSYVEVTHSTLSVPWESRGNCTSGPATNAGGVSCGQRYSGAVGGGDAVYNSGPVHPHLGQAGDNTFRVIISRNGSQSWCDGTISTNPRSIGRCVGSPGNVVSTNWTYTYHLPSITYYTMVNYTWEDANARHNANIWQGYVNDLDPVVAHWRDDILPAIQNWEAQVATFQADYAAWQAEADQQRASAKAAYEAAVGQIVGERNRWYAGMLTEYRNGRNQWRAVVAGKAAAPAPLDENATKRALAVVAAAGDVFERSVAGTDALLERGGNAPDFSLLNGVAQSFNQSARGVAQLTLASELNRRIHEQREQATNRIAAVAQGQDISGIGVEGFETTINADGSISATRQIHSGRAVHNRGSGLSADDYDAEFTEQALNIAPPPPVKMVDTGNVFEQWDRSAVIDEYQDNVAENQELLEAKFKGVQSILQAANQTAVDNFQNFQNDIQAQIKRKKKKKGFMSQLQSIATAMFSGGISLQQAVTNHMQNQVAAHVAEVTGFPAGIFTSMMGGMSAQDAVRDYVETETDNLIAQAIVDATGLPAGFVSGLVSGGGVDFSGENMTAAFQAYTDELVAEKLEEATGIPGLAGFLKRTTIADKNKKKAAQEAAQPKPEDVATLGTTYVWRNADHNPALGTAVQAGEKVAGAAAVGSGWGSAAFAGYMAAKGAYKGYLAGEDTDTILKQAAASGVGAYANLFAQQVGGSVSLTYDPENGFGGSIGGALPLGDTGFTVGGSLSFQEGQGVTGGSLTVGYGEDGLGLTAGLNFDRTGVTGGRLDGGYSNDDGFSAAGAMEFDRSGFTGAAVVAGYEDFDDAGNGLGATGGLYFDASGNLEAATLQASLVDDENTLSGGVLYDPATGFSASVDWDGEDGFADLAYNPSTGLTASGGYSNGDLDGGFALGPDGWTGFLAGNIDDVDVNAGSDENGNVTGGVTGSIDDLDLNLGIDENGNVTGGVAGTIGDVDVNADVDGDGNVTGGVAGNLNGTDVNAGVDENGNVTGNVSGNINGTDVNAGVDENGNVTGGVSGNINGTDVNAGVDENGNVTGGVSGNINGTDVNAGVDENGNVTGGVAGNINGTDVNAGVDEDGNVTGGVAGNINGTDVNAGVDENGNVTGGVSGNINGTDVNAGVDENGNVTGGVAGNINGTDVNAGVDENGNVTGGVTTHIDGVGLTTGIGPDGTISGGVSGSIDGTDVSVSGDSNGNVSTSISGEDPDGNAIDVNAGVDSNGNVSGGVSGNIDGVNVNAGVDGNGTVSGDVSGNIDGVNVNAGADSNGNASIGTSGSVNGFDLSGGYDTENGFGAGLSGHGITAGLDEDGFTYDINEEELLASIAEEIGDLTGIELDPALLNSVMGEQDTLSLLTGNLDSARSRDMGGTASIWDPPGVASGWDRTSEKRVTFPIADPAYVNRDGSFTEAMYNVVFDGELSNVEKQIPWEKTGSALNSDNRKVYAEGDYIVCENIKPIDLGGGDTGGMLKLTKEEFVGYWMANSPVGQQFVSEQAKLTGDSRSERKAAIDKCINLTGESQVQCLDGIPDPELNLNGGSAKALEEGLDAGKRDYNDAVYNRALNALRVELSGRPSSQSPESILKVVPGKPTKWVTANGEAKTPDEWVSEWLTEYESGKEYRDAQEKRAQAALMRRKAAKEIIKQRYAAELEAAMKKEQPGLEHTNDEDREQGLLDQYLDTAREIALGLINEAGDKLSNVKEAAVALVTGDFHIEEFFKFAEAISEAGGDPAMGTVASFVPGLGRFIAAADLIVAVRKPDYLGIALAGFDLASGTKVGDMIGKQSKKALDKLVAGASRKSKDKLDKIGLAACSVCTKCLPSGTPVLTPDGRVNIEDLAIGDSVLAFDTATGKATERKVTQLFRDITIVWYDIRVGQDSITATDNHPFWIEERGEWVAAKDLKVGDRLRPVDGELAAITSIETRQLKRSEPIFNIEVEGDHNYFAGDAAWLVHNDNDADDCLACGLKSYLRRFQKTWDKLETHDIKREARNGAKGDEKQIYDLFDRKTGKPINDVVLARPLDPRNPDALRGMVRRLKELQNLKAARGAKVDIVDASEVRRMENIGRGEEGYGVLMRKLKGHNCKTDFSKIKKEAPDAPPAMRDKTRKKLKELHKFLRGDPDNGIPPISVGDPQIMVDVKTGSVTLIDPSTVDEGVKNSDALEQIQRLINAIPSSK